jgi:hypothetical protein
VELAVMLAKTSQLNAGISTSGAGSGVGQDVAVERGDFNQWSWQ